MLLKPRVPFEEVAKHCAQRLFPDDPEFQAHFIKGVMADYTERHKNDKPSIRQPAAEAVTV